MTKYIVDGTNVFKKQVKKLAKQNKKIEKLEKVVQCLADGKKLDAIYKNHKLVDNNEFKNCWDCHIENDWVLIYKIDNEALILLLLQTGSHSELFHK